jgi:putative transposase
MPRLPRYAAPGQPQHVIQRGNNKVAVFCDSLDQGVFTRHLYEAMHEHRCRIHAYVFMTNHVHLLVTPAASDGISRMMQTVGRRYVRYFNTRHRRTGTLWEGRYRATLIDSDRYLLTCYRYIEENPVRARIVADPVEYRWSSHAANAFGALDALVSPHERYLALSTDLNARLQAYRELFRRGIEANTLTMIRQAVNRQWALGSDDFRTRVSAMLNRRAAPLRPGRPGLREANSEIRL